MNVMKAAVLFIKGFEEIEGLTIVDILRRADIQVDMVGVEEDLVTGAHNVIIKTDTILENINILDYDGVFLPGGAPGYINLGENENVLNLLEKANLEKKLIGAICASPSVLAKANILKGRRATIYPGLESEITKYGGTITNEIVVVDDHIITSKGPATSIPFALKLVEYLKGEETANTIKDKLLAHEVLNY